MNQIARILPLLAVVVLVASEARAEEWFQRHFWQLDTAYRLNLDNSDREYDESEGNTGEEDFAVARLAYPTFHEVLGDDRHLLLAPFVETRFNVGESAWERNEIGLRAGVRLHEFLPMPWDIRLNPRADGQYVFLDGDSDHFELELGADLEIPTPVQLANSDPMFLYVFEEWTLNVNEGRGARNEVGAGIALPWCPGEACRYRLEPRLGWRHLDFIGGTDTDYLEFRLALAF